MNAYDRLVALLHRMTWRSFVVVSALIGAAFGLQPGIGGWVFLGWCAFNEMKGLLPSPSTIEENGQ